MRSFVRPSLLVPLLVVLLSPLLLLGWWTSRQVLSAQQWVVRFITEQGADSTVADVPAAISQPWSFATVRGR